MFSNFIPLALLTHYYTRLTPPGPALRKCNAYLFLFLFLNQSMMMMQLFWTVSFVKVWQASAWESADQNTWPEARTKICCFTVFSTTNPIVNLQALHFRFSCVYLPTCWLITQFLSNTSNSWLRLTSTNCGWYSGLHAVARTWTEFNRVRMRQYKNTSIYDFV
jgi:hypothetical protein